MVVSEIQNLATLYNLRILYQCCCCILENNLGRIMKFLTIIHNTHLHLSLISFRQCDGSTFSCHCHELGHNRWKLHGKIFYSLLLIIRLLCLVLQFKLIFSFSNKVWKPFTLVFRAFYKRTNAKYQIHHSLFNLSSFGLALGY